MSTNFAKDINEMYNKFDFHNSILKMDKENLKKLLEFRLLLQNEETFELNEAVEKQNKEEIVDALIDIIVVAVGTLDLFKINIQKAWDEVLVANLQKNVGIKETRPNPNMLPDLIKPKGWKPPKHQGNIGILNKI